MTVSATSSEKASDSITAYARSAKHSRVNPVMNRMGTNTQTVVSVEANSEPATSSVPRHALSNASSPLSRRLVMLSMTTMLLSTSIPMPTASPPSDTILKVTPSRYSAAMAASTDSGIVTEMISDSEKRRRNTKITATASTELRGSGRIQICKNYSLLHRGMQGTVWHDHDSGDFAWQQE